MNYLIILLITIPLIFLLLEVIYYYISTSKYKLEDQVTEKTVQKVLEKHQIVEEIPETTTIQKNIIQTYKKLPPSYVRDNLEKLNPEWKYHFYDDDMAREFLEKEYSKYVREKFDSFSRGCHRADLFRLCWIYKNGGAYVDIDAHILIAMDEIIEICKGDKLIIPMTCARYKRKRLLNCMFLANKGNPIIKECIESVLKIEPSDLDKVYHLVLHTMQTTIGDRIDYKLFEINEKETYSFIFEKSDWKIKDKYNRTVALSRYENYDQTHGFG